MLEDMNNYLQLRAEQLGLERSDQLAQAQRYLDKAFPGQCRALSLNNGVLKITTPNASVASELRLTQTRLQAELKDLGPLKIHIQIR